MKWQRLRGGGGPGLGTSLQAPRDAFWPHSRRFALHESGVCSGKGVQARGQLQPEEPTCASGSVAYSPTRGQESGFATRPWSLGYESLGKRARKPEPSCITHPTASTAIAQALTAAVISFHQVLIGGLYNCPFKARGEPYFVGMLRFPRTHSTDPKESLCTSGINNACRSLISMLEGDQEHALCPQRSPVLLLAPHGSLSFVIVRFI